MDGCLCLCDCRFDWMDGMNRIADFYRLYKMYRKHHPRRYALERAYQIAFIGLPF